LQQLGTGGQHTPQVRGLAQPANVDAPITLYDWHFDPETLSAISPPPPKKNNEHTPCSASGAMCGLTPRGGL
jgi:hypothetical protein